MVVALHSMITELSRAHTSRAYHALAAEFISSQGLTMIRPCTYILSRLYPPFLCRSGTQLADDPGGDEADTSARAGHTGSAQGHGRGIGSVRQEVWGGPDADVRRRHLHMDGVFSQQRHFASHHKEQVVACTRVPEAGRRVTGRDQPHQGLEGHGCHAEEERLEAQPKGPNTTRIAEARTGDPRGYTRGGYDKGGSAANVLWCASAVRGGALYSEVVRPTATLNAKRHCHRESNDSPGKVGKESSTSQPEQDSDYISNTRPHYVSSWGNLERNSHHGFPAKRRTAPGVPKDIDPHAYLPPEVAVGKDDRRNRRVYRTVFTA